MEARKRSQGKRNITGRCDKDNEEDGYKAADSTIGNSGMKCPEKGLPIKSIVALHGKMHSYSFAKEKYRAM